VGVGKVILVIAQRLRLLSIPVYPEEKKGKKPNDFPAKYPNALALLLLLQLKKLERYNTRRGNTAGYYMGRLKNAPNVELFSYPLESIFLRFPILVSSPSDVMKNAKKAGVLLGNWYHNVIDPSGVDFRAIGYVAGSCPVAENIAKRVINLPTNIEKSEAVRVVGSLL
jgi:dTDP-4-amino-4,6-dideoxygalactose transaminase